MTQVMAGKALMAEYLGCFAGLIGGKRTGEPFGKVVRRIINAGSLVCQRVAAHSSLLSGAKDGGQRVIRSAKGESTKRSEIDAEHLVDALCQRGVEQLAGSETDEPWLIGDPSDLRKVWRTIWEQKEHLVCRISHAERLAAYQTINGKWREGDVVAAQKHVRPMASTETEMVIRRGRQKRAKRQRVTAEIRACPLRLTYDTSIRREGEGQAVDKDIWLVKVEILRSTLKPWLLITDRPVENAEITVCIFRIYRQRWAVEDSFKFTKDVLGWEEVQLLELEGIRTLLALAWVAAGFLYELGVTLEWEEVRLLARLGGWAERKDNPPGKIVLTRGLRRVMDMLMTQAILDRFPEEHGALPPRIATWVGEAPPPDL